ncbi:MAG: DUF4166 domain-containing protein [Pseudomonadota bacterium]
MGRIDRQPSDPNDAERRPPSVATCPQNIIVLGGSGVFGSRLVRMLMADGHSVTAIGRTYDRLLPLQGDGATIQSFDRDTGDFAALLTDADIVVDAAGPFQAYADDPYKVAKAAIRAGAHYLDLSDDAAFTSGIARFNDAAHAAGVVMLSGASSVPAISSSIASDLARDMPDIHLIESAILPGNRAPRGVSVMAAILAQVGHPLPVWTAGRRTPLRAWGQVRRLRVPGLPARWVSPIGAPDLDLFPQAFNARSVRFGAGLELPVMHLGLWVLGALPRLRLLRSLVPWTRPLHRIAAWLEPFGSDRGGMVVRVVGVDRQGQSMDRRWSVVAEEGDGPKIPALPARILVAKLCHGDLAPGARPCLAEFTRAEAEAALATLHTKPAATDQPATAVFAAALGDGFHDLPRPVRDLHAVLAHRRWSGTARVDRGKGRLARVICALVGFPPASDAVPVEITMERRGTTECWMRDFGGRRFRSHLSLDGPAGSGRVRERFGALSFGIALQVSDDTLSYPVVNGRVLGLPMPRWLLPVSETFERADGGSATFDVGISLPFVGLLVRYRGRIESVG